MDEPLDCLDMERKYKPTTWIPQAVHDELQATADRLQAEKDALMEALDIADRRIAELKDELESESNWADHYFSEWQKAIGSEYSKRPRS